MTRNTKQASALIAAAEEISIEAGIMDPHQMPPVLISFANIIALREALDALKDKDARDIKSAAIIAGDE